MEKFYSAEEPARVVREGSWRVLNYNIRETTEEEMMLLWEKEQETSYEHFAKEHRYSYHSVRVAMGKWNYGGIVETIVRAKYTTDEMEAITNNMNALVGDFFNVLVTEGVVGAVKHLVDGKGDANSEAFKEMQLWRAMAKKEAKVVLKID